MLNCICKELTMQTHYLSEAINTIYIGGGTPSLLDIVDIKKLIKTVYENYNVSSNPEITLEANPDDLNKKKLIELARVGINRLSVGIQSFDDQVLRFLNRAHNATEAKQSISDARAAGFTSISADLIYGIPDRDHKAWKKDLKLLIEGSPDHISAYCLTVEPKTTFGNWHEKGALKPVTDDFAAEQFDILVDELDKAGYEQYEVSNFAKAKNYSKHNTSYWQQKPYLGIGPSAHSYNLLTRQYNIKNNAKYMNEIEDGNIPCDHEVLSEEDKINDVLLTGLRTKWGINLMTHDLGKKLDMKYIDKLIEHNKAIIRNDHLVLTREGRLLADQISSDLFIIES